MLTYYILIQNIKILFSSNDDARTTTMPNSDIPDPSATTNHDTRQISTRPPVLRFES